MHYYCDSKVTEFTILKIAVELIKVLKNIHKKGILHRDLKPSNICYGIFEKNQFIKSLNIIDFNLGTTFNYDNNKNYHPQNIGKFCGTLLFASTAALMMVEQRPKDELETLFYVLAYLKTGFLPWQKYQNLEKSDYIKAILKMREEYPLEKLFNGFCGEVIFICKTIKSLTSNDVPDYDIYIEILNSALKKAEDSEQFTKNKYDWEIKIKEDFLSYSNSITKRNNLVKISFLKKGYPLSLKKFVRLFS